MRRLKKSIALLIAILMVFGYSFSSFAEAILSEPNSQKETTQTQFISSEETEPVEEIIEEETPLLEPFSYQLDEPAADLIEDEIPVEELPSNLPAEPVKDIIEDEMSAKESPSDQLTNSLDDVAEDKIPAEELPADLPTEALDDLVVEEKREEEKLSIKLTSTVDLVTITVSAGPGVLPQDTTLSVKALSDRDSQYFAHAIKGSEGTIFDNFKAFDITLLDSLGEEIQPNGQVEVSFDGLDFIKDSEEVAVYHLGSSLDIVNSKIQKARSSDLFQEINSVEIGDEVIFKASHFSIYGVGTIATTTYNFYVGTELKDTQIVLNGEMLKEPETPPLLPKKRFKGWQIEGGSFIDFSQQITVNAPSSSIKVNAVYENIVYVYFLYDDDDPDSDFDTIATKELEPGGTTNPSNVPIVVNIPGRVFSHWSLTPNGTPFNFNTPIHIDTELYAVLMNRWKVKFDAQGGNPILPKSVVSGQSIGSVEATTKAGYTFQHWSLTVGGTPFDLTNTQVTSDLKLYAVWNANNNTSYTVIYWIENADDAAFSYESSRIRNGTTGSPISLLNDTQGYSTNNISSAYRQYFTFQAYDSGKTIAGNGSTIVNVYFKRNSYNLRFYDDTSTLRHTITAKYGQYIADRFPIPGYPGRAWESRDTTLYPYALQTLDRMPGKDVKFDLYQKSSNTLKTIKYYTQNITGTGYSLLKTVETYFNFITYEEEYHPIQGFDRQSRQVAGFNNQNRRYFTNNNVDLYYLRKSYDLKFQNVNIIAKTETVKYEAPLLNYYNYIPPKPTGVPGDHMFNGWYTTPTCELGTEAATTLLNMPAGNAIVYAKWAPPTYSVKYYKTPNVLGVFGTIDNIPSGNRISESQLTGKQIPDGLTEGDFVAWYWYRNDLFVAYDFDTAVINNEFVLYPVWRNPIIYKVTYYPGDGSGTVPVDSKNYKLDAAANVLPPTGLTAPEGKFFIGWNTEAGGSGSNYYSNEEIIITGNMTLTAQWGELVPDTKLIYDANGGSGANHEVSLKNNATHEVLQNTWFTREDYEFIGWNTKQDGTGDSYQPYSEGQIDPDANRIVVNNVNPTENVLYAQWMILKDIEVNKSWVGQIGEAVTITLYANGTQTEETLVLSTGNSWKDSFKDLDNYDNGSLIIYTIEETPINNYDSVVTGNAESGFLVTNTQKFTTVVVTKVVAGNFGDRNREFNFTATLDEGKIFPSGNGYSIIDNKASFALKDGDSITLNVPLGSDIGITEDNEDYGVSIRVDGGNSQINNTLTFAIPPTSTEVEFTNTKNVVIDSGISLDSLPYILILIVVVVGGIWWMIRRRRHADF